MEILLSFLLGLVTYAVTEAAKKLKIPPRLVVGSFAAILAVGYMIAVFYMGKAEVSEILQTFGLMFATWYSTSNVIFEWIQKMLFGKTEAK